MKTAADTRKASAAKPKRGVRPPLQVNLYEAKTQLSALVERAAKGEEIVIAKAGRPMAMIVAMPPPKPREFGQNFLGITYMAPDWDAPMTEEELQDWGM